MYAPPPGKDEVALLTFLDKLDEESRAAKEGCGSTQWDTWLKQYRGQQWPVKDRAPMFQANILGSTIDRKVALLSESKPTLKVMPRRQGLSQTATILEKAIDAGWTEYNVEQQLEDIGYDISIIGASFLRVQYDPRADFGRGSIIVGRWDPRNVRIDPSVVRAYDLGRAQYVIFDSIEPLWQVWRNFPGRGALVKPDARYSMVSSENQKKGAIPWVVQRLRQTFSVGGRMEEGAIPRAHLREYLFHDPTLDDTGALRYPAGRRVIRGGSDVIILDEPNQYWDGGFDVEMLDGNPDPDHPWGKSEVESYRRLQEAINRVGHMYVSNRLLTGNVWVTADHDALEADAINMLKNIDAVIVTKRFGRTVERQMPPMMPPDMLEFIRLCIQLIDTLSGLSDGAPGKGRVELRSGSQLEGLQQAAQTLVRAKARRLEAFLERIGQKWISRVFQFMTDDRLMTFLGPGPDYQAFQFERQQLLSELVRQAQTEAMRDAQSNGGQLTDAGLSEAIKQKVRGAWRDFRFKVTPGSSLAATKMQRAMMFAQLSQNMMLSRKRVLTELGFPNPEEEIEAAIQEAQILGPPTPQKPQKGKKPSAG